MPRCPVDGSELELVHSERIDMVGVLKEVNVYVCEEGHIVLAEYDSWENKESYTVISLDELDNYLSPEAAEKVRAALSAKLK